eukprot:768031-Hanusia_phi.AAC.1
MRRNGGQDSEETTMTEMEITKMVALEMMEMEECTSARKLRSVQNQVQSVLGGVACASITDQNKRRQHQPKKVSGGRTGDSFVNLLHAALYGSL